MHAHRLLRPLEHLTYLIEFAASGCLGDLKGELANLCESIKMGKAEYDAPEAAEALSDLEAALQAYQAKNYQEGCSRLNLLSRKWWQLVAPRTTSS